MFRCGKKEKKQQTNSQFSYTKKENNELENKNMIKNFKHVQVKLIH